MKTNLKIIVLIMLLCSSLYAEELNSEEQNKRSEPTTIHESDKNKTPNEEHDKRSATMIQAPLQSELVEVYRGSEKVGKKAGKNTKNFFCSELGWSFFCKGDES